MAKLLFFLVAPFIIGAGCKSKANDDMTAAKLDTVAVAQRLTPNVEQHADSAIVIHKVNVLTFQKVEDTTMKFYTLDKERCSKWVLTKVQLEKILLESKIIDGPTWHYFFDIFHCCYKGDVIVNGDLHLKFDVNAGSSTLLYSSTIPNISLFLGYYGNERLFLEAPATSIE
ncbi:hypothetical protein [Chryseolinea lacunae]|uniref:Lipoprotein n=1 Tax=Chryseolinea lacunae TaxID=2801331 RepID=A0ABS1L2P3_9BACT|nr:hypothetical protein [Chryseolinea lacunae]MBL0745950.1 hypothetical protein [Chryseolinea lacunae]